MYAFKYRVEINWADGARSYCRTMKVQLYRPVGMKYPPGVAAWLVVTCSFLRYVDQGLTGACRG